MELLETSYGNKAWARRGLIEEELISPKMHFMRQYITQILNIK